MLIEQAAQSGVLSVFVKISTQVFASDRIFLMLSFFLFYNYGILLKKWDTSLDIAKQFEKQYDNQVRYAKDTSLVTSPIPHPQPHSGYVSLEQDK